MYLGVSLPRKACRSPRFLTLSPARPQSTHLACPSAHQPPTYTLPSGSFLLQAHTSGRPPLYQPLSDRPLDLVHSGLTATSPSTIGAAHETRHQLALTTSTRDLSFLPTSPSVKKELCLRTREDNFSHTSKHYRKPPFGSRSSGSGKQPLVFFLWPAFVGKCPSPSLNRQHLNHPTWQSPTQGLYHPHTPIFPISLSTRVPAHASCTSVVLVFPVVCWYQQARSPQPRISLPRRAHIVHPFASRTWDN